MTIQAESWKKTKIKEVRKMKDKINKKISRRGKAVLAILVAMMFIGVASAALLDYYGRIETTVTVDQGLTIDGKAWNDPITESATIYSTHEETVTSENHELQNTADRDAVVKLISTCSASKSINSCDETSTITVFELHIDTQTEPNLAQDRVVVKPDVMTIDGITDLSFDYMLTETTYGNSPYFVLALDTDDDGVADEWAVSWQDNDMAEDTWFTYDGIANRDWHPGDGVTKMSFDEIQDYFTGAVLVEVKVMIGYWGDMTPTTALVKNINVNGVLLADVNGIIVPDKSATDVNGHVNFFIETHFPQGTLPAIYTITTTAVLA